MKGNVSILAERWRTGGRGRNGVTGIQSSSSGAGAFLTHSPRLWKSPVSFPSKLVKPWRIPAGTIRTTITVKCSRLKPVNTHRYTPAFLCCFCELAGGECCRQQKQQLKKLQKITKNQQELRHWGVSPAGTWGGGGAGQLPQLRVGCQVVNVGLIHLQEDVLWLDVCVDDLAFSVQVI